MQDPLQEALDNPSPIRFERGGWAWTITPKASYVLRGVVLSRERYRSGPIASLSQWDVAMAWGKLLENDLWRQISWSQTSRWYLWTRKADFPRGDDFIARWSSNTHLIPATPVMKRAIPLLKKHALAELTGSLVSVRGTKRDEWWNWNSSLSREDGGDGSCEVLYLTRLKTGDRVYQ
jgi:hypothetical protein